jgi:hypothetical protein
MLHKRGVDSRLLTVEGANPVVFGEIKTPTEVPTAAATAAIYHARSVHFQRTSIWRRCRRTVIGCRGQGIAEIIQHGSKGFLVGPDNDKELTLAAAIF